MRRKEREIIDQAILDNIIQKSITCSLGLVDGNIPYIIPMCFGYHQNALYFHCALKGKKIDVIKKNNNVCFEFDTNVKIVEGNNACNWGIKYQSIVGFGKAVIITDVNEKIEALNIIMKQYSDGSFTFNEKSLSKTGIIKVEIESMTGKHADS